MKLQQTFTRDRQKRTGERLAPSGCLTYQKEGSAREMLGIGQVHDQSDQIDLQPLPFLVLLEPVRSSHPVTHPGDDPLQ